MPKLKLYASASALFLFFSTLIGVPASAKVIKAVKPASAKVVPVKSKSKVTVKKPVKKTAKKATIKLYGVNYKVKAADTWKYNKKTAPAVRDSLEAAEEAREKALLEKALGHTVDAPAADANNQTQS